MHLDDGTHQHAGVLALGDPAAGGRYRAEFRYEGSWLKSQQGFALDLSPCHYPAGFLRVPTSIRRLVSFSDALPDRWGRALLLHGYPLSQRSDLLLLTLRGRNGLGSIEFVEHGARLASPRPEARSYWELCSTRRKSSRPDSQWKTPPSALARRRHHCGRRQAQSDRVDERGDWIVKFPSKALDGRFDMIGLEKATMDCARAAGIRVPDTRIEYAGAKKVLFVKRFDVTDRRGRHHMISLSTLCKERSDYNVSSYDDLADAVRKHSANRPMTLPDCSRMPSSTVWRAIPTTT